MMMDVVREIIINVATEKILPRFNNLKAGDISAKSPGDMVSIADIEAEIALIAELTKLFPDAVIGGEESISEHPELLRTVIAADRAFLIDPVDGTNNFIKGDDKFAVMVVELRRGAAVAAWIYLPVSGGTAMAEQGGGAYLDGKKIRLSASEFNPATMIAAAHINRFPEDLRITARKNIGKFMENSPAFCAGYDYIALTRQQKDFALYYRTLPWDHLPGTLIYSEAGGYVRTLFNEKYFIDHQDRGLLSAPNQDQWHNIRAMIFPDGF